MIRSMTGYGKFEEILDGKNILVEIKSVNHRYFEFSAKTPRGYTYLEEKLKGLVAKSVSRGKIEVYVSIYNIEGTDTDIKLNIPLAKSYIQALRSVPPELDLNDNLTLTSLQRYPDIFIVERVNQDEEVVWQEVESVASRALERFVSMREAEGEKMLADMREKLDNIESTVCVIEELSPKSVEDYKQRLYNKLKEVLEQKDINEQRVLTEVCLFADKIAVDEETVRLRSHLAQFRQQINQGGQVGRKLDFLVQEINREVNTIGSKCQAVEITNLVVNMKNEIEKLREQLQNIE